MLCTLQRRMRETAAAVVLIRIFGHIIFDTHICAVVARDSTRIFHNAAEARGSVAGSRNTQNVSNVVAKGGGQEESQSCEIR